MSYFSTTKKFGQHYFVDFCWLKNQMKYRKSAIFDNPKGISKRKYGLKKSTSSVDQIFFVKTMMSQLFKFVSKTNKKLWTFSPKYCWYFKIILPHISILTRTYSPLKNFQILIQKSMKSVYLEKSAFLTNLPKSLNFICNQIDWCWPSVG